MNPRHLYIHVPFCGRRCVYCDFSIAVRRVTPVDAYLGALAAELAAYSSEFASSAGARDWTLDTVYLGGGTPSRLGGEGVRAALDLVRARAAIDDDAEVTIEANPEDVTPAALAAWRSAGVNRVSLGAQSFDDSVLKWMHRSHTGKDVARSVECLRESGIGNFSLDLIFALPDSLGRSWSADLDQAIALAPPHISVYGLTVEPRTPLARWISSGTVGSAGDARYADEFLAADSQLRAAGYSHYEVSNYAHDGMASRHNSAYWTGADYLGIGPSAHSLIGGERRWNVGPYEEWRSRLLSGADAVEGREKLNPAQKEIEDIYLGLRTDRGFAAGPRERPRIQRWVDAGWGTIAGDSIRLNAAGWLRLDSLAADLGGTGGSGNYISSHGSSSA